MSVFQSISAMAGIFEYHIIAHFLPMFDADYRLEHVITPHAARAGLSLPHAQIIGITLRHNAKQRFLLSIGYIIR